MQAEHVIVIAVNSSQGTPEEVYNGAIALTNRYGAYAIDIDTPLALPAASQWQDYIEKHGRLRVDREYVGMVTRSSADIGVYIVSHGGGGKVAQLTGDQWAMLIKELGFQNIRKLCVVACWSASDKLGQSFIQSLCDKLDPLTPMIAGWDGFVTIAEPELKGNIGLSLHARNLRTAKTFSNEESNQIKFNAQKLTKMQSVAPMAVATPEEKDKIKLVFQKRAGKVTAVALSEWTDKG